LRLAVINAHASTIGDGGGVDLDFDEGLLLVGEAGIEQGALKASIGGWLYTRKHDDLFVTDLGGVPLLRRSRGLFAVAEWMMPAGEDRELTWFMRGGISDGRTSPFSGGAQAGFKLAPLLTQRPDGPDRCWRRPAGQRTRTFGHVCRSDSAMARRSGRGAMAPQRGRRYGCGRTACHHHPRGYGAVISRAAATRF
jgi:Carbohydrate-selective porin, OprB family